MGKASDGAWFTVAPDSGEQSFASQTCSPGPIAVRVDGQPHFDCDGGAPPWWVRSRAGESLLVWPNGSVTTLASPTAGERLAGRLSQTPVGSPALSADGTHVYAPVAGGVLDQPLGGASTLISRSSTRAVAAGRDGTFLYVLGGGRLDVYEAASHAHRAGYAVDASKIELVAGG